MMRTHKRVSKFTAAVAGIALGISASAAVAADTASEIDAKVDVAMQALFEKSPAAAQLAKVSKGILMFPQVVKGGFIVAAEYGSGALREDGKTTGYYNTVSASYGLQAGVETFGYAMFFVTDSALEYLKKSHGWEAGAGPTLTVVDAGIEKNFSTSTLQSDMYAFFFSQKGLMGGLALHGTKISQIHPEP